MASTTSAVSDQLGNRSRDALAPRRMLSAKSEIGQEASQGSAKRRRVVRRDQQAGIGPDGVAHRPAGGGDDRQSARQGLGNRHSVAFVERCRDEQIGAVVERRRAPPRRARRGGGRGPPSRSRRSARAVRRPWRDRAPGCPPDPAATGLRGRRARDEDRVPFARGHRADGRACARHRRSEPGASGAASVPGTATEIRSPGYPEHAGDRCSAVLVLVTITARATASAARSLRSSSAAAVTPGRSPGRADGGPGRRGRACPASSAVRAGGIAPRASPSIRARAPRGSVANRSRGRCELRCARDRGSPWAGLARSTCQPRASSSSASRRS